MEDDLKKKKKWKTTSEKNQKWKTTLKKMEDDLKKQMEDELKKNIEDDLHKLNGKRTNQPKST